MFSTIRKKIVVVIKNWNTTLIIKYGFAICFVYKNWN